MKPAPPACIDCHFPFRHKDQKLEDFPDTVIHSGRGRCRACYTANRSARIKREKQLKQGSRPVLLPVIHADRRTRRFRGEMLLLPDPSPADDTNMLWLREMVESRRARGIPTLGQPLEEWVEERTA